MDIKQLNIERLVMILNEANMIMSKHDRVHSAHAARCNIECCLRNVRDYGFNYEVDWDNIEGSIKRLRNLKATGRYN